MRNKVLYAFIFMALAFPFLPLIYQSKAQTEPTVSLTPSNVKAERLNETFAINITISNVQNLGSWDTQVDCDPKSLKMTGKTIEGDFMSQVGGTAWIPAFSRSHTSLDVSDSFLSSISANGSGVLATLYFQVIGLCAGAPIRLSNLVLQGTNRGTQPPLITPTADSSTARVTLFLNGPPIANAGENQTVRQGNRVIFNASYSASSESNPTYTWSFIDGASRTLEGIVANYTFNTPGTYAVTLTIRDSRGSDNSTITITVVSNTMPIAKITIQNVSAGQLISVNQSITFSGKESYEPNNGTIVKFLWNMGDGTGSIGNSTITYAYKAPGNYNVTLTVFDTSNNNATALTTIQVSQSSNSSGNGTQLLSSLPPAIVAILSLVTAIVLTGSIFWLRKKT